MKMVLYLSHSLTLLEPGVCLDTDSRSIVSLSKRMSFNECRTRDGRKGMLCRFRVTGPENEQ